MEEPNKEYHYIQFPLCLLQETYKNPLDVSQALNIIGHFGIVNYAKKFEYSKIEVGRQLMYAFYRAKHLIQNDLLKVMLQYIDNNELTIDGDYNGFYDTTFDPLEGCELLTLFEADVAFYNAAITRYQIIQAANSLKVSLTNIDFVLKDYNKGLKLEASFEQMFGADSWISVKLTQLIQFRDSATDIDLFRAYLGIKSMIGKRNFISTNKPAILSRMIGCKSKAAFEYFSKDNSLMPVVNKYSNRYQMDKLLMTLAERSFIMYLSKPKVSVIYVSTFMEPEQLGELIRQTKNRQNLKKRMKLITASL